MWLLFVGYMSSRRIEEIDGEEYIIKEVVSKTSSIGRLLWTINQFIIAPFLIGTSGTIGVGFG